MEQQIFSRVKSLIGEEKLNLLSTKTVMIIGVGGVGSSAVEGLVRSGIGKVILVDFDVIDPSNLNRQLMTTIDTIGLKKVDVLEKRIKSINPDCCVVKIDKFIEPLNINILFDYKFDYLIDACDSLKTKFSIIDNCIEKNIKFISSMGTAKRLDPTKLKIVDIRKTYNDPLAKRVRKYVNDSRYKQKINVLFTDELPVKTEDGVLGSMIFVPNTAGLIIANKVILDLIN